MDRNGVRFDVGASLATTKKGANINCLTCKHNDAYKGCVLKAHENACGFYNLFVMWEPEVSTPITPECPKAPSAFDTQVSGTHYIGCAIQPFQYSMANKLDSMQHTIIKYITRFRTKNGIDDLLKARHTLDLLIEWEQTHKETK